MNTAAGGLHGRRDVLIPDGAEFEAGSGQPKAKKWPDVTYRCHPRSLADGLIQGLSSSGGDLPADVLPDIGEAH
ncbi:hypothetical protein D3C86_2203860 [compost metagenome]